MRIRLLSWIVVGLALGPVANPVSTAPEKPATPERIAELVRQLGDKEFAKREAAGKELDAIGEPAREALKTAVASGDAEVRERARKVLDSLDVRVRIAAGKKDLEKLQGTWYTTAIQSGGGSTGEDRFDTITYEGTKYVQRRNGYVWAEGTIEIVDATAQPKRIDYFGAEGAGKGLHVCAIYTLKGEEHAVCSGVGPTGRPGEFSGKAGFLRVTRREKTPPRLPESRFDSAVFSTDLRLAESKEAIHRVALKCRLADGESGTLTLDPTAPKFNDFGDSAPIGKPAAPVTLEFTFKLAKSEVGRNLFELRGPKVTSRLSLVAYADRASWGDGRLLIRGKDGDVLQAIDLNRPDRQQQLYPPCHPGCFPAGTAVQVPEGTMAIERLREGDEVTTIDADGKAASIKIKGVFKTRNRLLEVRVDGGKLVTTETQPIALESGGFRAAGELKPGDKIWRWADGKRKAVAVKEVTSPDREAEVFNLILGEPTRFVAGGFLVRSKPPAEPRP
ncbi:MAG TPA: TIGR03067 domain-containing protein [Gemmataceae bacterium]|nr:TIGR03067 domain-containing protein [Gemmataceae bacterium]